MDAVTNCLRHHRYAEEGDARRQLAWLKGQSRKYRYLQAYECKTGGESHWHIGNPHYRRSRRKRRKR